MSLHGRKWAEREALVALAGVVAQRKARQELAPLSWMLEAAFHEAAHSVIALKTGMFPWVVSIVPNREVKVGKTGHSGGYCHAEYVHPDEAAKATIDNRKDNERPARNESDFHRAARYSLLLAPSYSWRDGVRTYHALLAKTGELVDEYWIQIVALAGEIRRNYTLDYAEIRTVIREAEQF